MSYPKAAWMRAHCNLAILGALCHAFPARGSFCRILVELFQNLVDVSRLVRPSVVGRSLAHVWPIPAHLWPIPGQISSKLVNIGRTSAELSQFVVDCGPLSDE